MNDPISKRQFEIIQAAGKLLLERGIKGLTTKNLAAEMNFSESALYRHFKNKEDLIVFLLDYLRENMQERLLPLTQTNKQPIQGIMAVFESQFAFFSQNPHFIVAVLSEGLVDENPKIAQSVYSILQLKSNVLSQLIEAAKASGQITQTIATPDILHILLGSFRLMMLRWKMARFSYDLEREGAALMRINLQLLAQ